MTESLSVERKKSVAFRFAKVARTAISRETYATFAEQKATIKNRTMLNDIC